jgi:hypothetical protein
MMPPSVLVRRALAVVATALISITLPAAASAQSANDKAAAEALFDQGKALMATGNYTAACPKFSESLRLDVGVGTSLWLAECYERSGKLASAWAQFREAAAIAVKNGDPREKIAREHAATLEPKLPKLAIVVPRDVQTPSLKVLRDGEEVGAPLWGTPMPTDSGDHTITVSAQGKKTWSTVAHVSTMVELQTIAIPVLEEDPYAQSPEPPPGAGLGERDAASQTQKDPRFRIGGIVLAGLGFTSLIVGTAFGIDAMSNLNDSNAHCGQGGHTKDQCDGIGVSDRSTAITASTASTVGFVAGGLALAGGAALFFLAPNAKRRGPSARIETMRVPRGSGLSLHLDW